MAPNDERTRIELTNERIRERTARIHLQTARFAFATAGIVGLGAVIDLLLRI